MMEVRTKDIELCKASIKARFGVFDMVATIVGDSEEDVVLRLENVDLSKVRVQNDGCRDIMAMAIGHRGDTDSYVFSKAADGDEWVSRKELSGAQALIDATAKDRGEITVCYYQPRRR